MQHPHLYPHSSGIGAELAEQYGALGAKLVLAARRLDQLQEVAEKARAKGAAAVHAVQTDMSNRADVEKLIAAAVQSYGGIDTLVLNHAAVDDEMVEEHKDAASLEKVLRTVLHSNLFGSAVAAHAALPYLEESSRGGHIAVVSSATAIAPAPFHSSYAASKRALGGFFDSLRHELHLTGRKTSIGIQILGMIGTPAVMKDPGNHFLAIPVPECAQTMICAIQARFKENFVPHWYWPMTAGLRLMGTDFTEWAMNSFYINNVEDYVRRMQKLKEEGPRQAVGTQHHNQANHAAPAAAQAQAAGGATDRGL